ncbi:MAG: DUF3597 family protein [Gluconacetobacter diazotrophicus]|nr:DUF3597 family protein [Gluconacetobacter diazotrophicus]
MSLFGSIVDKIVHYAGEVMGGSAQAATPAAGTPGAPAAGATSAPATAPAGTAAAGGAATLSAVDIGRTLSGLAEKKGETLNWQASIVDLLKLLDLDSSLSARKELAQELNVHVGADGSAEQNVALHKAVVQKLAENGGQVPAEMRS